MAELHTKELSLTTPAGCLNAKVWTPKQTIVTTPLVLLHDSLGSVAQWRDFPALLAQRLSRRVIAYDRLGFGQSSARQQLPSIHFIAEEAEIYFPILKKALSLNEFLLLGHSVGGGMAINIAACDPDCVGIITIAAQAFVEALTLQGIRHTQEVFSDPVQIAKLEKWHGEKANWVLRAWTERWLSPEFGEWSLENCIDKVHCPALIIHGENDEYGSTAFPNYIANNISHPTTAVILKNCGHLPHKEKTEEVLQHVAHFVSTIKA